MIDDLKKALNQYQTEFKEIVSKLDLESKHKEKLEIQAKMLKEDFWNDSVEAEKITSKLAQLEKEYKTIENLEKKFSDAFALLELIVEDEANSKELEAELEKISRQVNNEVRSLEVYLFLSHKYDKSDAYLSIHAGQGGTEACDWAAMLARMYSRYADKKGWKCHEEDSVKGEETGIKSITYSISGEYVYGYLKHEAGTHRLVRLSPFNANNLRQTSFALVEVTPVIDENITVEIKDDDIIFEAYRSAGHGGQNVNKVSTAVRIKHIPTGIVVTCQAERSQGQNRQRAMKILQSKLQLLEEEKIEAQKKSLKGEFKKAAWGNQIRSYVLQPYKMVKDLRTKFESSQPEKVLDGELDDLIMAELKQL